jgi:hypothetical protein
MIFEKENFMKKNVILLTSLQICPKISHSKKNSERYDQKCILNFHYTFSKYIQILNFMKILPVEGESFNADGRTDEHRQTDRHDEVNSRFPQLWKRA